MFKGRDFSNNSNERCEKMVAAFGGSRRWVSPLTTRMYPRRLYQFYRRSSSNLRQVFVDSELLPRLVNCSAGLPDDGGLLVDEGAIKASLKGDGNAFHVPLELLGFGGDDSILYVYKSRQFVKAGPYITCCGIFESVESATAADVHYIERELDLADLLVSRSSRVATLPDDSKRKLVAFLNKLNKKKLSEAERERAKKRKRAAEEEAEREEDKRKQQKIAHELEQEEKRRKEAPTVQELSDECTRIQSELDELESRRAELLGTLAASKSRLADAQPDAHPPDAQQQQPPISPTTSDDEQSGDRGLYLDGNKQIILFYILQGRHGMIVLKPDGSITVTELLKGRLPLEEGEEDTEYAWKFRANKNYPANHGRAKCFIPVGSELKATNK